MEWRRWCYRLVVFHLGGFVFWAQGMLPSVSVRLLGLWTLPLLQEHRSRTINALNTRHLVQHFFTDTVFFFKSQILRLSEVLRRFCCCVLVVVSISCFGWDVSSFSECRRFSRCPMPWGGYKVTLRSFLSGMGYPGLMAFLDGRIQERVAISGKKN